MNQFIFLANFTVRKHNGFDGWFENDTYKLVYAASEQEARQKVIEKYDLPDTYIQDLEITKPII